MKSKKRWFVTALTACLTLSLGICAEALSILLSSRSNVKRALLLDLVVSQAAVNDISSLTARIFTVSAAA